MATLIPAEQLIIKFKYAYDNKWGYILNTAGILWTQEKQNTTTNSTNSTGGKTTTRSMRVAPDITNVTQSVIDSFANLS